MSNNDRFPRFASTRSMSEKRMFTDEYLVDPRQESWSNDAITRFMGLYDHVTVSDQEIFEEMYPVGGSFEDENLRKHSGKSRGDCVESVLKRKIGESYRGLVDPDLVKSFGWQAKEAVYDIKGGVTYYFFKRKGDGSYDTEQDESDG